MNKNTRRIFAAFASIAVLAAGAATGFAEYDPNKVVTGDEPATKAAPAPFAYTLNNADIEAPAPFFSDNGTMMLPLRAITEAMGFEIQWQGETSTIVLRKGAVQVTMNAKEDGYTFSRTAPMTLGNAPVLTEEGLTYVPANFFSEILDGAIRIEENGIAIYDSELKNIAVIEAVNAEEKQITVKDIVMGEVVLNIADETYITDEEGKEIAFEELVEGLTLKVDYSEMMSRSIPPMNTPSNIVVKSGSPAMAIPSHEAVEAVAETATIVAVDAAEASVLVNDETRGEVVLNIGELTTLTDAEGKEIKIDALKEGMKLEIVYGEAMTMSIPPMNNPVTVRVIAE